jgi:hypothetical protein
MQATEGGDMTTAPVPVPATRREPRAWLVSRPFWASIAIVAIWVAVIADSIAGHEIVAVAPTTTTTVPTVVITGLLAAIATIFVARYGFAPERRDG